MARYFSLLLLGALAVCALAHEFDEDDESYARKTTTTTTTTPKPRPNIALDDTVLSVSRAPVWDFSRKSKLGPRNWAKRYPKCRQLLQAPISIDTRKVIPSKLYPLKFKNLDAALNNLTAANIFRFGILDFTRTFPRVSVKGGPLPRGTKYYLAGAYVIVGKNNTNGSLHAVNGKKAPFEISFLFHPRKNITLETIHRGSEFIIHFLGKVVPLDNPNYAPVVNSFKKIVKAGSQATCGIKSLRSILPRKAWEKHYFTYTGSSFVPPCKEGRIRIVYKTAITISAKQLKAFRGLYNEKNKYIWNNYRPLQKNKYVQVFSSVEYKKKKTSTTRRTTTAPPNIVTTEEYQ